MTRKFIVSGRVQGVGFRAFVLRLAREHGLVGEVWNTRAGNVEIVATGDDLEAFQRALSSGPGRVERVHVEPAQETDAIEFTIGSTR